MRRSRLKTVIAHYRKKHLLEGEARVFGRGSRSSVFEVQGMKVGINIYYDLSVPESIECAAASGRESARMSMQQHAAA